MFSYTVDLLTLREVGNNNYNFINKKGKKKHQPRTIAAADKNGIEQKNLIKFYDIPSQMQFSWAQVNKKSMKAGDYHLENFGLLERKILKRGVKINNNNATEILSESKQLEYSGENYQLPKRQLKDYFDEDSPPDFLCNSTCLKKLMIRPKQYFIEAVKVRYPNGKYAISLRPAKQYLPELKEKKVVVSNGERVEDLLSTGVKDKKINKNIRFEAIYYAKLSGPNAINKVRDIHIGFNAETDGLWKRKRTDDASNNDIQKDDLVEVKCLTSNVFIEKITNQPKFYYEEQVLRENWAQCRLRGIDKLLCGVVDASNKDNKVLREIWLYSIEQIPRSIGAKLPNERAFKRCFPRVNFSEMSDKQKEIFTKTHDWKAWKKWTEQQEFQALFDSLETIEQSFYVVDQQKFERSKAYANGATNGQKKYFTFFGNNLVEIFQDEYENLLKRVIRLEVTVNDNPMELSAERIRKYIFKTIKLNMKEYPTTITFPKIRKLRIPSIPCKAGDSFILEFEKVSQKGEFFNAWKNTSVAVKKMMKMNITIYHPNQSK